MLQFESKADSLIFKQTQKASHHCVHHRLLVLVSPKLKFLFLGCFYFHSLQFGGKPSIETKKGRLENFHFLKEPSFSDRIMSDANETETQQQREQSEREQVLESYRTKIREHREVEARLKRMREDVKGLTARYQKTEDDLTALQSVGQIIGDVLKRLDSERFIVKASSGPRYVVGCRSRLNHDNLKPGTRVALDMTTLTIMRILPREVDPTVFHMQASEEDGGVSFADIGGLNEQIRELREVIELPLTNPELFIRVGIKVCQFCLFLFGWLVN